MTPANRAAWVSVATKLPPQRTAVDTKIDDGQGVRNETTLMLYRNLWWFPDMSMYVYYAPTHWRPIDGTE